MLHAGGHAKFFAAPCYQAVRESGEDDFAEGQDFLVIGVGFGMGS